jgi:predicted dehydrogenase
MTKGNLRRNGAGIFRQTPPDGEAAAAPIRLCLIGAGGHSRLCHLPALEHYRRQHPGSVVLAGIADTNRALAESAATISGAGRVYTDLEVMLREERPDACFALVSVSHNAPVAIRLMEAGIPVLMEKPLGATIGQARRVAEVAARLDARVMVSMNRRFDPLLREALAWIGGRPARYVRVTMTRHNRREEKFLEQTGLHAVDTLRMIAGDVSAWRAGKNIVEGIPWIQIETVFTSGARGLVDVLPTTGAISETYEIFGAGYRAGIHCSENTLSTWRGWENGVLVHDKTLPPGTPACVSNGTCAETRAFFENLRTGKALYPAPCDVLPSMELCHAAAMLHGGQNDASATGCN